MSFEWWWITAASNAIMVVIYAVIATIMIRGIQTGHQWRTNPIAVATAAVFVTCTVAHGQHLLHLLPPLAQAEPAQFAAAQAMFNDPALVVWDGFTASVAVWYFLMRSRLVIVYEGAALCEDIAERQRQAALLHEKVVEGLARAERALENGEREAGLRSIEATLEESKTIITTLVGRAGTRAGLGPGDLRRDQPSH